MFQSFSARGMKFLQKTGIFWLSARLFRVFPLKVSPDFGNLSVAQRNLFSFASILIPAIVCIQSWVIRFCSWFVSFQNSFLAFII